MRRLLPLGVAAIVAYAPFSACSDAPNPATTDGGSTDDADVRSDSPPPSDAADPGPSFNADGWLRIDYPNCNFYAAPSAEKMPAPLVWEPCSSILAPLNLACQQIKFNWVPPSSGNVGVGVRGAWVGSDGKARLSVGFGSGPRVVRMIADADGPVHQAISYEPGACAITNWRVAGANALYTAVRSGGTSDPEERGAIGGDIDRVPLPLEHWADGAARGYTAGPSSYFASGSGNAIRPYDRTSPPLGVVAITDPGQISPRTFVGSSLFYEVASLSYSRIKVYSPSDGARDLISFGNDVSANATAFGTDGIDMVWIEATGRATTSAAWTTIDIMTSPFTSDASKVQKRRLRSEKGSIYEAFAVGCGYAAHNYSSVELGNGVRVVRLSDGHSWRLSNVGGDGSGLLFNTPRAITCDDVFVNIDDGHVNTLRIRLDSLGSGEAAD
jgi:hypothetical protein